VGILSYGSCDFAITESRDELLKQHGLETDYMRIRAYPFPQSVHDFVASHERVYVVEQNRDAQMQSLLKLDLPAAETTKLRSVLHFNGLPMDADSVTEAVVEQEGL
jgi:2-oxoglutarate ferredoxin oxidoreductase subunit alpha